MGEYNHLSAPNQYGPTKDLKRACPVISASFDIEQRAEACISPLEFIFGTEGLSRLEGIKASLDPKHLFNCYGCIGYRSSSPEAEEVEPVYVESPSLDTTNNAGDEEEPADSTVTSPTGSDSMSASVTIGSSVFRSSLLMLMALSLAL